MCTSRQRHGQLAILILLGCFTHSVQAEEVDLTGLSLEQLLDVKVVSASKFEQLASNAPSAVQVITREDIQRYGWRTLTEALNSLPGIYYVNDRSYDYLGARGFLVPGDYNTRFLLLIDGQRNNDNIYQMALTGNEGWLDMSVVERIEYIPGPGSAIYGSNAMFGVINVITRGAGKTPQSQVGTYVSQLGLTGVNAMTSQQIDGTGLVLQYSAEHLAGRDRTYTNPYTAGYPSGALYRPDGTPANDGVAHGLDYGNSHHLMMRVDHQEWSFKLINHERYSFPSSAPFLTVFDDPSMKISDGGTQLTASVQHELSAGSSLYARLGYTDWHYRATYPYNEFGTVPYYHNYDDNRGRMLDGEFRYQLESGAHHLLSGLEFSRDLLARQHNFFSATAPLGSVDTNINPLINHGGLFVQDEWKFTQGWLFSMGLRLDSATYSKSTTSPRLGLIWQVSPAWTAKLLTGRAYRSPNAYESWFSVGTIYLSNPNLHPETIRTTEGVVEWMKDAQTRWMLSLFDNKVDQLIQQVDTGAGLQYQNGSWARVHGAELGLEKTTSTGLKFRGSVAYNQAQNGLGTSQGNSPNWIGKVAVNSPIYGHAAYLAGEIQAIGSRTFTWSDTPYSVGSEVLANATVTFPKVLAEGLQAQLRVTNLFNRDVQHPASTEMPSPLVPQNGRNLMAKLDYAF